MGANSIGTEVENSYTCQGVIDFFKKWAESPLFVLSQCIDPMYKRDQTLIALLQPVISALGYELWGVEHFPKGSGSLLRVYIDKLGGITLADCERVSHQVVGILDVHDPISGSYELEVSSPGLDRPLFTLEQMERYLGCWASFKLKRKLDGRRNITGEIEEVSDDTVTIGAGDEKFAVPADMIDKAHLAQRT